MLTLTKYIKDKVKADEELMLPLDQREKTRLRATLASGEDVALLLPRGMVLRDGTLLLSDDGRVVKIVAAAESVYRVRCHDTEQFARCAYHLGNRHTPVQIVGDEKDRYILRIREDKVLKDMLEGLGAHITAEKAPFEPESGAYGSGGHNHHNDGTSHDHAHAPRIHHADRS